MSLHERGYMIRKLLITLLIVTFVGMGHIIYEQQKSLKMVTDNNNKLFANLVTCLILYDKAVLK